MICVRVRLTSARQEILIQRFGCHKARLAEAAVAVFRGIFYLYRSSSAALFCFVSLITRFLFSRPQAIVQVLKSTKFELLLSF